MGTTAPSRSYIHVEYDAEAGESARPRLPLLEMTIRVFGWEQGQAEIDGRFVDGPDDPFGARSLDVAHDILARLRIRLQEEIDAAFEVYRGCVHI